jgi:hypothetical protein
MSEIDWATLQKEANSAGLLPDGDYSVICIEASATTSSTGKPMIKTKFRVTDGPQKDKPIWSQFVVSPESAMALRIYFQHMAAFGLDSSFFASNPTMEDVARNLVNRGALMTLGTRPWQGQDRNDVKGLKPLPSGAPLAPGVVTGPPTFSSPGGAPNPMGGIPSVSPVATTSAPATPSAPPTQPF